MLKTFALLLSLAALPRLISARVIRVKVGVTSIAEPPAALTIAGVTGGRRSLDFTADRNGQFTLVGTDQAADHGNWMGGWEGRNRLSTRSRKLGGCESSGDSFHGTNANSCNSVTLQLQKRPK